MKALEKKYLLPFALVTSLFLLWGLANNMTDTLLAAFKRIMDMSDAQTSLIQFAFYGSYFCFALPAAIFISRHSFKSGIILGLLLYAAGAILFLPAAYAASYGFYLVAIYIMAGGCSVLETTANPYILSMGSPETATRRQAEKEEEKRRRAREEEQPAGLTLVEPPAVYFSACTGMETQRSVPFSLPSIAAVFFSLPITLSVFPDISFPSTLARSLSTRPFMTRTVK